MASSIGKTWAQLGHFISVGIDYYFNHQGTKHTKVFFGKDIKAFYQCINEFCTVTIKVPSI